MINTNNPLLASYAITAQTQTRPADSASGNAQNSSEAGTPAASVEVRISQEALQAQQADAARQANAQSADGNDRQVNASSETANARNDIEDRSSRQASDGEQPENLTDGQQQVGVASTETLG